MKISLRVGWLCYFCLNVLVFLLLGVGCGYARAENRGNVSASASSTIVGDWLVESRDAIIHIEQVGDEYQGYIRWQLHDTYGPEDGPGLNGKIVTDRHNPDPSLRSQPLTGLKLLKGLRYDTDRNEWVDGHIYNADNGHTYNCWVRLLGPNRLKLHGYVGISLLGGSTEWSRVTIRSSASDGLPYVVAESSK